MSDNLHILPHLPAWRRWSGSGRVVKTVQILPRTRNWRCLTSNCCNSISTLSFPEKFWESDRPYTHFEWQQRRFRLLARSKTRKVWVKIVLITWVLWRASSCGAQHTFAQWLEFAKFWKSFPKTPGLDVLVSSVPHLFGELPKYWMSWQTNDLPRGGVCHTFRYRPRSLSAGTYGKHLATVTVT